MSKFRQDLLIAVAALAILPCAATARDSTPREPSLEDIVEVRSIDGLMLSPDGKSIAYRVTSPSLRTNGTTVQWFTVPVDGTKSPLALGASQVPIWLPLYDSVDLPQARWIENSTIAALGIYGDAIQVHQLGPGGYDRALTSDPADIVSFTLEGTRLAYQTRADRGVIAALQAHENERGIRLDRSLDTDGLRLTDNFRVGERLITIRRQDAAYAVEAHAGALTTKETVLPHGLSAAGPKDRQYLGSDNLVVGENVLSGPSGKLVVAVSPPGENEERFRKYAITFIGPDGTPRACTASFCRGTTSALKGVTIIPRSGEVVAFVERDFSDRTTILGWHPRTGKSRIIRQADGSLGGGATYGESPCAFDGNYAVCVKAGPTEPASLVRVDLHTGSIVTLAAPNAKFAHRNWGEPRLLEWKDEAGRQNHGVLLLPANHSAPLPLVMTTYRCRGFLRGGTGWHVAEHLLIQRGIAALCVSANASFLTERDGKGERPPLGPHLAQIAGYKAIIDRLSNEGTIDRSRVGISGHSFTSMVVGYAISHTGLFAAAESVGNTIDPGPYFLTAPTSDSYRTYLYPAMGLPLPDQDPDGVIPRMSPALNAAKITAPLLMQPPESEYLSGLQLYQAIATRKGAVDLYVFPFEDHMGTREPAHIYWRNRRSADWFSFWLTGKEYPDPAYADQYTLWRAMRTSRENALHNASPAKG